MLPGVGIPKVNLPQLLEFYVSCMEAHSSTVPLGSSASLYITSFDLMSYHVVALCGAGLRQQEGKCPVF